MRTPSLDFTLMCTAMVWSKRSHAVRKKVGAVLSKQGRIISIGYNGTLPGSNNSCEDHNGNTKSTVLHAEENALAHCLKHGISPEGADLHITLAPCEHCAMMLIYSGIKRVVYLEQYRKDDGLKLLLDHGVEVYYMAKQDETIYTSIENF